VTPLKVRPKRIANSPVLSTPPTHKIVGPFSNQTLARQKHGGGRSASNVVRSTILTERNRPYT
jgi:hypothetical protein